ncbi:MAG: sigma-70 family RNA polymerase sigma factor [Thermoleophilaceae bacterium]|nr:sigma-70 family RNA polymerase sigma factor [Thermoleophilaceae bacterium]
MARHRLELAGATASGTATIELELERHRRELTGYCYRMLGSWFESEDAVQETMVRAWRSADRLEARAALRSWLYRIATNVCLDMLKGTQRRARPMDLSSPATADSPLDAGLPESAWVQPAPDARLRPETGDPAELATWRETIRLAFVAALQHLPPRQRAVLLLRDVLRWQASEVAELLDTSVASVNSALQRARATLEAVDADATAPAAANELEEKLLARYVDAFERYDIETLVSLIREDASFSMPPYRLWLRGGEQVGRWMLGQGSGCRGSRLLTTSANGSPAVAIYRPAEPGVHRPFNVAVLEIGDGRIVAIHNFLFTELFPAFGLPPQLES